MAYENTGLLAFANSLSGLGQNIGTGLEQRYKQQSLADLVPMIQQGKYGEAGAAMMQYYPETALKFLEKQRQTDEFNKLYPQETETSVSPSPASVSVAQEPAPYNLGSFGSAVSRTLGFEGGKGIDTNGAAVNYGVNAASQPWR